MGALPQRCTTATAEHLNMLGDYLRDDNINNDGMMVPILVEVKYGTMV